MAFSSIHRVSIIADGGQFLRIYVNIDSCLNLASTLILTTHVEPASHSPIRMLYRLASRFDSQNRLAFPA